MNAATMEELRRAILGLVDIDFFFERSRVNIMKERIGEKNLNERVLLLPRIFLMRVMKSDGERIQGRARHPGGFIMMKGKI
jgi:hypothetical protein